LTSKDVFASGTQSEYALPGEILDSAASAVQAALQSPDISEKFDASQLESLRKFLGLANSTAREIPFDTELVFVDELVERNPAWNTVRTVAQKCLDALGTKIGLTELLRHS
jgi:hypothetical protein